MKYGTEDIGDFIERVRNSKLVIYLSINLCYTEHEKVGNVFRKKAR